MLYFIHCINVLSTFDAFKGVFKHPNNRNGYFVSNILHSAYINFAYHSRKPLISNRQILTA